MSKRKGEITAAQKDRTHPWQVELPCEPGGRGLVDDAIDRWVAVHHHETKGGQRSYTYCFCAPEVANDFAEIFGGRRIDQPVILRSVAVDRPDARELERRRQAARIGMDIIESARAPLPSSLLAVLAKIEAKRKQKQ